MVRSILSYVTTATHMIDVTYLTAVPSVSDPVMVVSAFSLIMGTIKELLVIGSGVSLLKMDCRLVLPAASVKMLIFCSVNVAARVCHVNRLGCSKST